MPTARLTSLTLLVLWLLTACGQAVAPPTATPTTPPSIPPTDTPPTVVLPTSTATTVPTDTPAPTATPLPYTTPDWFKQAVVYQIFVRSFYDTNGDGIGDLAGVTAKLDYLQSLGVTTLWLNPIHPTTTYHGYDVTDYYGINPDFGTQADLQALVDAAHARDMRVVLDYVANHMSNENPIFKDAYAQPQSQYANWFLWKDAKQLTYQSFFGNSYLPQVNHGEAVVRTYFVDVAKHWMDLDGDGDYTDGIDGLRADYALGPLHRFWKELRGELKVLNPDFLLLGEVWVDDPDQQAPYLADEFDAVFDFPVFGAMMGQTEQSNDGIFVGKSFISIVLDKEAEARRVFPPEAIRVRFFSNHDTDRLATELSATPERLILVPWLLAALDGVPAIYYGEELGQTGHKGLGPIYDEYRREPLDWYAAATGEGQTAWFSGVKYTLPADGISVEEQAADPTSLLNTYRTALALRQNTPALHSGDYAPLKTSVKSGVWAFWRYTAEGQIVAAVFNFGLEPVTLALDLTELPVEALAAQPVNLVTGETLALDPAAVTLEPGAFLLLDWTP